jgi:hypothetical protein
VVGAATVTGLSGPGDALEFFQITMPKEQRGPGGPLISVRGDAIGVLTNLDVMRDPTTLPTTVPTTVVIVPADGPTWAIKAQAARPLFITPPPQPPAKSREEAVLRASAATCLIEVTR